MASIVVTFLTIVMVSANGHGVESAPSRCDTDHQCEVGYFCYEESHYCTHCVDCTAYKRKSSWRSCPKTPSDCGTCIHGFEEEILHEGRTRDMCVPSVPNSLSQTTDPVHSYERYLLAVAVPILVLLIVYVTFCSKSWRRDRGTIHHGLHHEEPPPYRSIELTTLPISNNSVECLQEEEDHVLHIGQQKDTLVQAIPFRQPDYVESELVAFDNINEIISDVESSTEDNVVSTAPNVDLHDDNTMPSDWTPDDNSGSDQLMSFESHELGVSSESEDTCEQPASKRHKSSSNQEDQESCNTPRNTINLYINNNVVIHKPS